MIKFGTGGWRALIGEDFIKPNIKKIANALVLKMKDEGVDHQGIVIGFDRRFLSDKASRWMAEIFALNKIPVYYISKVAPTPVIMYCVKTLELPYGIAVTASHNPADYNGIKIFIQGGRDAPVEITADIEHRINELDENSNDAYFQDFVSQGRIKLFNPFNGYIDTILSMLDVEAIKRRSLNILLDPMYGVSKTALQTILMTARCEVDVIHDRHDTMFGGRLPSPSAVTLNHLKNLVVEKHYDIGIGTDGDADRLGVINEKGEFIHPNKILVLLYYYLLKYKKWSGPVVRNIATTHQLDCIAEHFNEKCYEVPVGFKYISSKMEETQAVIGGESSGGLTIEGHIKGKDGIFAAGLLVEMISVTGKSLAEMLIEIEEQFGTYSMVEQDFRFNEKEKKELYERLYVRKELPDFGYAIEKISQLDGIKVYFKNGGWIISRFSGTEPLLRIFAEMPKKEYAEEVLNKMMKFLGMI